MQIRNVIIGRCGGTIAVDQGIGIAAVIIQEVQSYITVGFPEKLTTGIDVVVGNAVYCLAGTNTVAVVGVGVALSICCGIGQSPTFFPGEGPTGTVVVADGIAGTVIGNGLSVISRQEVRPLCIPIGVSVSGCAIAGSQDVATSACVLPGIGLVALSHAGEMWRWFHTGRRKGASVLL